MHIYQKLNAGKSVAIPLDLDNMTMFHISFVPLWKVIADFPVVYSDGSNRGVQINIDRHSSYALPRGCDIQEPSYITEKWGLTWADAEALLPFINTVLTGKDYFLK